MFVIVKSTFTCKIEDDFSNSVKKGNCKLSLWEVDRGVMRKCEHTLPQTRRIVFQIDRMSINLTCSAFSPC